jgi:branched-chain amino acid transport system permease protein
MSAHILVMVILGGMGSLFGPILGAFAFEGLHHWFASLTPHWELPMGVVVIAMVLLLPRGIAGLLLQLAARKPTKTTEVKLPRASKQEAEQ